MLIFLIISAEIKIFESPVLKILVYKSNKLMACSLAQEKCTNDDTK